MLFSKLPYFILFVGGLIIGVLLSSLFDGCGSSFPSHSVTIKPAVLKTEVAKQEISFLRKIDSLQVKGKKLSNELQSFKQQMEKYKKKNIVLQTRVYDLLDSQGITSLAKDTTSILIDCDTLKSKVVELINFTNEKDSIYESEVLNLAQQVDNRDSVIVLQSNAYHALHNSFDQALDQWKFEKEKNLTMHKQSKRQKFKNTFKTITVAILAAVGTHYLANH